MRHLLQAIAVVAGALAAIDGEGSDIREPRPSPDLLPLGVLTPFSKTTKKGITSAYEGGRWRSVAVAIVETARQFNARNGSFYEAFGMIETCNVSFHPEIVVLDTNARAFGARAPRGDLLRLGAN